MPSSTTQRRTDRKEKTCLANEVLAGVGSSRNQKCETELYDCHHATGFARAGGGSECHRGKLSVLGCMDLTEPVLVAQAIDGNHFEHTRTQNQRSAH